MIWVHVPLYFAGSNISVTTQVWYMQHTLYVIITLQSTRICDNTGLVYAAHVICHNNFAKHTYLDYFCTLSLFLGTSLTGRMVPFKSGERILIKHTDILFEHALMALWSQFHSSDGAMFYCYMLLYFSSGEIRKVSSVWRTNHPDKAHDKSRGHHHMLCSKILSVEHRLVFNKIYHTWEV